MKVILENCSVFGLEILRTLVVKRLRECKFRLSNVRKEKESAKGKDLDYLIEVIERLVLEIDSLEDILKNF